jgi:MFS transporter, SP family, arabinose:H+ symporter
LENLNIQSKQKQFMEKTQTTQVNYNFTRLIFISSVAALGGFLFGYDLGVISGAIVLLTEKFQLSSAGEGWAAASAVIGCIVGAVIAGNMGEKYGRKKSLILCAVLFLISAIGSALPEKLWVFAIYRLIGGIGLGIASTIAPPYIAESAPAQYRGRLVSLYQLAIVMGIVIVHFTNLMISYQGDQQWNVDYGWRWMFGSEAIPATIFLVLLIFLPESPRWLVSKGKEIKALELLQSYFGRARALEVINEIKETLVEKKGKLADFWQPGLRKVMIIAVLVAVFQQFSGINMIMNFATVIFQKTGSGLHMALGQTMTIGVVNFIFTLIAIWLVDKVGRKVMLWVGSMGLAVTLTTSGYIFYHEMFDGPWALISILMYVAFFASTVGPVVWVYVAEIFPNQSRAQGMAIVTLFLWSSNYINIQVYPILEKTIGTHNCFWAYAVINIFYMLFVLKYVNETKGKTLEQIEMNIER